MSRYLIIADDFTGANDTGVQLKRRGIATQVFLSSLGFQDFYMEKDSSKALVIDTESRGLPGDEAYSTIANTLKEIDFSSFSFVIKKVDSTLRGNVAVEIKAIDDLYKSELIIFAPALPDLGRTTLKGVHRLQGTPITLTEMGRDPKTPVKEDRLQEILKGAFQEEVIHVSLEEVESGNIDLSKGRVFSFDAMENDHIKEIIRASMATGKRVLWVGSAALADNIMELQKSTDPVLSLIASISSVTRKQVKYAESKGAKLVKVDIPALIEGTVKGKEYTQEALEHLRAGRDTIVLSSASYDNEAYEKTLDLCKKIKMDIQEAADLTQRFIGTLGEEILQQVKVSGIFLTGGDTAIGFFRKVQAQGSNILGEVAIGIPIMTLTGGPFNGLKVITKAGAFGGEDAIHYSLRKLKEV